MITTPSTLRSVGWVGIGLLNCVLLLAVVPRIHAADAAYSAGPEKEAPPDPKWLAEKAQLQALGEHYTTAWDLYQSFKDKAHGGTRLVPATVPDWSGIYYRHGSIFRYDIDRESDYGPVIAPLRPEWLAKVNKRLALYHRGVEFDSQLSNCLPAGMPRWFTEPYLREFVVTPNQTWMMNELANETRRIYTDGRDHPNKEDRYPMFDGDSIGFWDGDKLVVHTDELIAGQYQRSEPDHTADAEVVEVWHKVDDQTLRADVWVYDPKVLRVPWYTRQVYDKQPNQDNALRIRYYDCVGTPNTQVKKTKDGSSTFVDLDFDKARPNDPYASPTPDTSTSNPRSGQPK